MGLFSRKEVAVTEWDELGSPWRSALTLAWDAYRKGTVPVGAVVVDSGGAVVARGRDAVFDAAADFRGVLAHAPVVALSQLDPVERHEEKTLYTTVEPCLLCLGAAVTATVGAIRFLAPDPYAGASSTSADSEHARRLVTQISGPVGGPVEMLASVLVLEPYLRVNPEGSVAQAYASGQPAAYQLTTELIGRQLLQRASQQHASINDVVETLWPILTEAG